MKIWISLTTLLLFFGSISAQKFNSAHEYMSYIGAESEKVSKQMLTYVSSTAHSNREKKSEAERNQLIDMLKAAHDKVAKMEAYEGDAAYRDAVAEYYNLNYIVMKEDYEKILDMEAIAEQSFDAMETYITAHQAANEKVSESMDKLSEKQKAFGAKYNIRIVESDSEVSKKLAIANEAINYYNQIYLIFFKAYKQEFYTLEAVKAKDLSSIEQNRNAQITYADEGLAKLEEIPVFKGDGSLKNTCKKSMEFFKSEATTDFQTTIDFYVKKDNFEKSKASFDLLKNSERTQEAVNQYNTAVNEYNEAVKNANASNESSNKKRSDVVNGWNKAVSDFMAKHIPQK